MARKGRQKKGSDVTLLYMFYCRHILYTSALRSYGRRCYLSFSVSWVWPEQG